MWWLPLVMSVVSTAQASSQAKAQQLAESEKTRQSWRTGSSMGTLVSQPNLGVEVAKGAVSSLAQKQADEKWEMEKQAMGSWTKALDRLNTSPEATAAQQSRIATNAQGPGSDIVSGILNPKAEGGGTSNYGSQMSVGTPASTEQMMSTGSPGNPFATTPIAAKVAQKRTTGQTTGKGVPTYLNPKSAASSQSRWEDLNRFLTGGY